MGCNKVQGIAVPAEDVSKVGLTDANGLLQHRGEHWFQITWRAADDLEDFRRGRPFLKGRTQFVEQPRVLDSDDGLGGEVLNQIDLLVCEGADFLALQANTPISSAPLSSGTNKIVRMPPSSTAATIDG